MGVSGRTPQRAWPGGAARRCLVGLRGVLGAGRDRRGWGLMGACRGLEGCGAGRGRAGLDLAGRQGEEDRCGWSAARPVCDPPGPRSGRTYGLQAPPSPRRGAGCRVPGPLFPPWR